MQTTNLFNTIKNNITKMKKSKQHTLTDRQNNKIYKENRFLSSIVKIASWPQCTILATNRHFDFIYNYILSYISVKYNVRYIFIQQYRNNFCYTIFNKCLVLRMPRQQKQYLTLHCKVAKHCTLLSQITLRKKFLRFTYLYFGSHEHFSSVPTVFQTLDVACDFFCMVMKISHFLFISWECTQLLPVFVTSLIISLLLLLSYKLSQ